MTCLLFFTMQGDLDKVSIMKKSDNQKKETIYYIFDPLCGWCYGFEPVMMKIQEQYKDRFNFEVIPGGMVRKENAQPIANMREFLLKAIPNLEDRTGIKIGQKYYDQILMKEGVTLDSEMPSRVFLTLAPYYPNREAELAKEIQDLLYQDGLDLGRKETYSKLDYMNRVDFESQEAHLQMRETFDWVSQLGVRGFPALLIERSGKFYQLGAGYMDYGRLSGVLDDLK